MSESIDIYGKKLKKGVYQQIGGIGDGDFFFVNGEIGKGLNIHAYRTNPMTKSVPLSDYEGHLKHLTKQQIQKLKSDKYFNKMLKKSGLEEKTQSK